MTGGSTEKTLFIFNKLAALALARSTWSHVSHSLIWLQTRLHREKRVFVPLNSFNTWKSTGFGFVDSICVF